jgi:hypothetical protein
MNVLNENQHFVSRVLLERFKIPGSPLRCYQVKTGKWMPKSPESACSASGYNQLLQDGQLKSENTLEADFSAIESRLPKTFVALEKAAEVPRTELPADIYKDICKYCAFLKLMAPYAKPGAVVSFVFQLNMELEKGGNFLLRELKIPEEVITFWRQQRRLGHRIIVDAENLLQSLYWRQHQRNRELDADFLLNAHWTIFRSPIELPISDVGLVPIGYADLGLTVYLLPIGRNLLLKGLLYFDLSKNSTEPIVKSLTLSLEEAEYVFDCICSSAIVEIVSSKINPDIPTAIDRAKTKGIRFHKIPNLEKIMSAGMKNVTEEIIFQVVSVEAYKAFMHSYMQPAEILST